MVKPNRPNNKRRKQLYLLRTQQPIEQNEPSAPEQAEKRQEVQFCLNHQPIAQNAPEQADESQINENDDNLTIAASKNHANVDRAYWVWAYLASYGPIIYAGYRCDAFSIEDESDICNKPMFQPLFIIFLFAYCTIAVELLLCKIIFRKR